MSLHTQVLPPSQVPLDPVENLYLSDCTASVAEVLRWSPIQPDDEAAARSAIVHGYLYREWSAIEAFNALVEFGLFGDLEAFMETFCAGVEALASRMPELPPQPDLLPPQQALLPMQPCPPSAPSVRCAPSDEILEAIANGRAA